MGFLDKAKEQASALAAKAQEGVNQGQAKLSEAQANKKAGDLLEQLGAWQWAQQHGRDAGQASEQIVRIVAELEAHEAEHGVIPAPLVPTAPAAPVPGAQGAAPPPPGAAAPPPPAAAPPVSPQGAPPPPGSAPQQPIVPEGGFTLD